MTGALEVFLRKQAQLTREQRILAFGHLYSSKLPFEGKLIYRNRERKPARSEPSDANSNR